MDPQNTSPIPQVETVPMPAQRSRLPLVFIILGILEFIVSSLATIVVLSVGSQITLLHEKLDTGLTLPMYYAILLFPMLSLISVIFGFALRNKQDHGQTLSAQQKNAGILMLVLPVVLFPLLFYFISMSLIKPTYDLVTTIETESVSPTSSPENENSTINWKTYTDQTYTVKYPNDWQIEIREDSLSSINRVSFEAPNEDKSSGVRAGSIYIMAEKQIPEGSLKKFDANTLLNNFTERSEEFSLDDVTTQQINGRTVIIGYGGCCLDVGKRAYMLHNDLLYTVTLYGLLSEKPMRNEAIFDQVLSTFTFLN